MATSNAENISRQLIDLLKEQGLYEQLPEIAKLLQKEADRGQEITIISSTEITSSERIELEKTLTDKWGEHPFVYTVDPIVLSGMIIKFQDKIIDMSGRGKLTNLAQELK